ncbi:acetylhydrolase [Thalassotalea sp. M1531]|uniref:Acetylhydrolase n=1 Tax=Thalassotalea algicola TaxID=2716224 RepID=A0A7Y0Q583_9GAMM|nr:acetylhydrolase [Thalassotalea algicola]NMP30784.1 acetylhydrolase [Thalassotalea algicola]
MIKANKPFLILLLSVVLSNVTLAAEQLYRDLSGVMPELAKAGSYNVGVKTQSIVNSKAFDHNNFNGTYQRKLTIELWYPAKESKTIATYQAVTRSHKTFTIKGNALRNANPIDEGSFPFVVISHGYTGDRTLLFYLAEHLASHGYIVAAIDHTDSTTKEIDVTNAPMKGFASTLIHRSRDQQFVLDYFRKTKSPISAITNFNKATVIGYSMGGYGAINTVGGCYEVKPANLMAIGVKQELANTLAPLFSSCSAGRETVDPSWKAMVAFAPWGQEHNLHSADSLANLKVPSLYISGEQDDISGFEHGVKKLFEQTGSDSNFLLVYENARHNIAPHPAPRIAYQNDTDLGHYYEPSWSTEKLNRINQHFVLAFLNCNLKQQQCEYLPTRIEGTQQKLANGKYSKAWIGFPERWLTGVKFYKK